MADKERFTSSRSQDSASAIIPVKLLLLIGILALVIGIVASQWVGVALVIVALCVTYAIGAWAGRRGDALVVAVAILLFWMPFQTTVSRLDVSPQEISVTSSALFALCSTDGVSGSGARICSQRHPPSCAWRFWYSSYPAYSPSCGSRIQTC